MPGLARSAKAMSEAHLPTSGKKRRFAATLVLTAVAAALTAGCAGGTQGQESVDSPATDTSAIAAAQTTAADPAATELKSCEAGLPIDEQKKRLAKIAESQFSGTAAHDADLPRLHYPPDARDNRSGGIFVSIDFNGDEFNAVAPNKEALDLQMRDAYETFYTAGCEDLAVVQLNARMRIYAPDSRRALPTEHGTVFRTKLSREVADTVDWANKEVLDFNEVWDTVILNIRWKKELEGD